MDPRGDSFGSIMQIILSCSPLISFRAKSFRVSGVARGRNHTPYSSSHLSFFPCAVPFVWHTWYQSIISSTSSTSSSFIVNHECDHPLRVCVCVSVCVCLCVCVCVCVGGGGGGRGAGVVALGGATRDSDRDSTCRAPDLQASCESFSRTHRTTSTRNPKP